jgi:hypothetical protein
MAQLPPIYFEPVGRMIKLQERVHGMSRLCRAVGEALRSADWRQQLLATARPLQQHHVRRIHVLVSIDDIPLPDATDRIEPDGTLLVHMQTVGASDEGERLFPDYVYGGWWHIGLHDYDDFAAAMAARAAAPYVHPQLFWIGNVEMSPSRSRLVEFGREHPGRIDARGMRWAHARGNVTEETGERAATDGWVTLQRHAEWRYLIDVEGLGWSGRLKLLPHAGRCAGGAARTVGPLRARHSRVPAPCRRRPLLVQQRPYWDWASSRLKAGDHFLSVGTELEAEVLRRLDWLEAHPEQAQIPGGEGAWPSPTSFGAGPEPGPMPTTRAGAAHGGGRQCRGQRHRLLRGGRARRAPHARPHRRRAPAAAAALDALDDAAALDTTATATAAAAAAVAATAGVDAVAEAPRRARQRGPGSGRGGR